MDDKHQATTANDHGVALEYLQAGRLEKAATIYRNILREEPDNSEALHMLGLVAHQSGHDDIAMDLIGRAIGILPSNPCYYNSRGSVCMALNRYEEALSCYRQATSIKPDYAEAHNNLASAWLILGEPEKAITSYRKALIISPEYAQAHRQLAEARTHTSHDDGIRAMQALYTGSGTTDEQKMHLAFGLGKAMEDLEAYEESFNYIQEANRLKRKTMDYSVKAEHKYFSSIMEIFTPALYEAHSDSGNSDKTPIFIVGMPRSGTSLVEQILCSHPQVYGAGELNYLAQITRTFCINRTDSNFPECAAELQDDDFHALGTEYLDQLRKHSDTSTFITDKMPQNFLCIGLIRLILPNAKIIHCTRDPMDNCYSIFKNYFSGPHGYAYNQTELGQYYSLYQELMAYWKTTVSGFIYDIRYEDLVTGQEDQTRKLLEYCGLQWDERCLSFYRNKRGVSTASATQVRSPVYADSIEKWKHYKKQLAPLEITLSRAP